MKLMASLSLATYPEANAPKIAAARSPLRQAVFLTHGEETGIDGLRGRLAGLIPDNRIIMPGLDDAFQLRPNGCSRIDANEPLTPEKLPAWIGTTTFQNFSSTSPRR